MKVKVALPVYKKKKSRHCLGWACLRTGHKIDGEKLDCLVQHQLELSDGLLKNSVF